MCDLCATFCLTCIDQAQVSRLHKRPRDIPFIRVAQILHEVLQLVCFPSILQGHTNLMSANPME